MNSSENGNGIPGQVPYRLTAMLKDWLDELSADPEQENTIQSILQTISNYTDQLKSLQQVNPQHAARAAHQTLDQVFAATPEEDKKNIQCKLGCTACCYIDLTVTGDEVKRIIDYCKTKGINIDKDYLYRQSERGRAQFSEISKCVFLENGLCSVYEVRPANCRKHFVKSDPVLCDSSLNNDTFPTTYFNLQAEMVASALLNAGETGPIEQMLLKEINDIEQL